MKKAYQTISCFMAMVLMASASVFHVHDPLKGMWASVDTNYWSKYVTEGRDNLDEGSLLAGETLLGLENMIVGIWYGYAGKADYDELNLLFQYDVEVGPVTGYVNYARLEFFKDDASDNELGIGIAYDFLQHLSVATDLVYSTEAEGAFVTVTIGAEIPFMEESLVISPYLMEAIDIEYASIDYSGLNNFELGLTVQYQWSERISFIGRVHHSIAQKGVKDDGLGDETWAILGLEYFLN